MFNLLYHVSGQLRKPLHGLSGVQVFIICVSSSFLRYTSQFCFASLHEVNNYVCANVDISLVMRVWCGSRSSQPQTSSECHACTFSVLSLIKTKVINQNAPFDFNSDNIFRWSKSTNPYFYSGASFASRGSIRSSLPVFTWNLIVFIWRNGMLPWPFQINDSR